MTNLNDLLPVRDEESLRGVDLDALPDTHSMSDGLTMEDLLPVEDGHDIDGMDVDAMPNLRISRTEVQP